MATEAMIGKGTRAGLRVISDRIQPGASPPGVGSTKMARPNQTKDMPKVTTIDGKFRRWIRAPKPA